MYPISFRRTSSIALSRRSFSTLPLHPSPQSRTTSPRPARLPSLVPTARPCLAPIRASSRLNRSLSSGRGSRRRVGEKPSPPSFTALGKAYEEATEAFLNGPSWRCVDVKTSGQAGDGGVDARGRWGLWPFLKGDEAEEVFAARMGRPPSRMNLIVQCKASGKPVPAAVVRELVGAVLDEELRVMPARSTTSNDSFEEGPVDSKASTVGFLVALTGFTRDAIETASRALVPLVLLHLEPKTSDALAKSATSRKWLTAQELDARGYTSSRALDEVIASVRDERVLEQGGVRGSE